MHIPSKSQALPTPEDTSDWIESRAYWQDAPPFTRAGRHLTFEISALESWSFPRAHLICFEIELKPRANLNSSALHGDPSYKHKLILKFPACTMLVATDYPRALLEGILAGDISILVCGEPKSDMVDFAPKQTKLPFTADNLYQHHVFTGKITPKTPEANHD